MARTIRGADLHLATGDIALPRPRRHGQRRGVRREARIRRHDQHRPPGTGTPRRLRPVPGDNLTQPPTGQALIPWAWPVRAHQNHRGSRRHPRAARAHSAAPAATVDRAHPGNPKGIARLDENVGAAQSSGNEAQLAELPAAADQIQIIGARYPRCRRPRSRRLRTSPRTRPHSTVMRSPCRLD